MTVGKCRAKCRIITEELRQKLLLARKSFLPSSVNQCIPLHLAHLGPSQCRIPAFCLLSWTTLVSARANPILSMQVALPGGSSLRQAHSFLMNEGVPSCNSNQASSQIILSLISPYSFSSLMVMAAPSRDIV